MLSEKQWEKQRSELEKFIGVKISRKRIKSIEVNPRERSIPRMVIEVGKKYGGLEPGAPTEEIIAIYESTLFCVCTPARGLMGTQPYYFLREDVIAVKESD